MPVLNNRPENGEIALEHGRFLLPKQRYDSIWLYSGSVNRMILRHFAAAAGSVEMLARNVHHNFLVAGYSGTIGGVDNDDGSKQFERHHNFNVSTPQCF